MAWRKVQGWHRKRLVSIVCAQCSCGAGFYMMLFWMAPCVHAHSWFIVGLQVVSSGYSLVLWPADRFNCYLLNRPGSISSTSHNSKLIFCCVSLTVDLCWLGWLFYWNMCELWPSSWAGLTLIYDTCRCSGLVFNLSLEIRPKPVPRKPNHATLEINAISIETKNHL